MFFSFEFSATGIGYFRRREKLGPGLGTSDAGPQVQYLSLLINAPNPGWAEPSNSHFVADGDAITTQ
jgi:hypothetical protein